MAARGKSRGSARKTSGAKGKNSRIEARISHERKQLLQQAADLRGESLSDFVLSASQEKAVATLQEARLIRLSVDDQLRFADALLHPPEAAPALRRAAERYREQVKPAPPGA